MTSNTQKRTPLHDSAALPAGVVFLLAALALLLTALLWAMGIHDADAQMRLANFLWLGEFYYSPHGFATIVMSVLAIIATHQSFFLKFVEYCQRKITHWTLATAQLVSEDTEEQCRLDAREKLFLEFAPEARASIPLVACFIANARLAVFAVLTDFVHAIRIFHVRFDARIIARPRFVTC